ncbi:hypothetical protein PSN01_03754 [Micromonospora saelicesensis]|nr:hypothetical protein PSN01_03754 [Micromonospora saelicesensis]
MFSAMAAAWPCSSALTPGSAPGVSTRVTTGRPRRAARRMSRSALRCPDGLAMPKLRATNSAVVCPFWWPMTITCRPANRATPPTMAGQSAPSRSPCNSTNPSKTESR